MTNSQKQLPWNLQPNERWLATNLTRCSRNPACTWRVSLCITRAPSFLTIIAVFADQCLLLYLQEEAQVKAHGPDGGGAADVSSTSLSADERKINNAPLISSRQFAVRRVFQRLHGGGAFQPRRYLLSQNGSAHVCMGKTERLTDPWTSSINIC